MGKSEKVCRIFHVAEGTQCSSCDDRNFIGASHKLATSARVVLQHYVVISPLLRFMDNSCFGSQIPVSSLEYLAL